MKIGLLLAWGTPIIIRVASCSRRSSTTPSRLTSRNSSIKYSPLSSTSPKPSPPSSPAPRPSPTQLRWTPCRSHKQPTAPLCLSPSWIQSKWRRSWRKSGISSQSAPSRRSPMRWGPSKTTTTTNRTSMDRMIFLLRRISKAASPLPSRIMKTITRMNWSEKPSPPATTRTYSPRPTSTSPTTNKSIRPRS